MQIKKSSTKMYKGGMTKKYAVGGMIGEKPPKGSKNPNDPIVSTFPFRPKTPKGSQNPKPKPNNTTPRPNGTVGATRVDTGMVPTKPKIPFNTISNPKRPIVPGAQALKDPARAVNPGQPKMTAQPETRGPVQQPLQAPAGMAKGGMTKKMGYAKGGMVKANCGASMKPTQKGKK